MEGMFFEILDRFHFSVVADFKCHSCDNYATLNKAFKDRVSHCEEYENASKMEDSKSDCSGYRFDGCLKMVTKSWKASISGSKSLSKYFFLFACLRR